jgi:pyrroloquinoline quinone biosynthesis protein B
MVAEAILLGVAQDGGVPQAGCRCARCQRAWADPSARQWPACLGLVDGAAGHSYLVDATPAFPQQLRALQQAAPASQFTGILLTHAHVGHYAGLIHLGGEVMGARGLPVYATAKMAAFLRANAPWSQLVGRGNIALRPLELGREVALGPGLHVRPLPVPHRDEWADTVAYLVRGPGRSLFYCPDTDGWARWAPPLEAVLAEVDVALLDATFYAADEVPGRDLDEIPHPLVPDTVARLAGSGCEVVLIHLNHTNPLLDSGPEREAVARRGARVGAQGDRWALG